MKIFSFDTEFRNSRNKDLTPVAANIRYDDVCSNYFFPPDQDRFVQDFRELVKDRAICAFFAGAEVRFLLSVGFTAAEVLGYQWLDVFVLWRMLTHSNPPYKYGRYFKKNADGTYSEKISKKPPFKEELFSEDEDGNITVREPSSAYAAVPVSLVGAVGHRLGVCIDSAHKEAMRTLILSGENDYYTQREIQAILDYCATDTVHLKPLLIDLLKIINAGTRRHFGTEHLIELSRYAVCCGITEATGIPLSVDRAEELGANFLEADKSLVEDCNTAYPFFIMRKSTKKERDAGLGDTRYVESYAQFEQYVRRLGLESGWPRSEKGALKKTKETLRQFEADPGIMSLWRTKDGRTQLKYFRPEGFEKIRENIGDDERVRVLLGPFGSKTGRSQPSVARGYIFGMSSWIRPLIAHPTKVVLGADFSAQEIALQGFVSGDENFVEAYKSGDPYTWFAQMTGGMPAGTYRKNGKFHDESGVLLPPEGQLGCASARQVYKALLLGVGFGMGLDKLGESLTLARVSCLPPDDQEILRLSRLSSDPELLKKAADLMHRVRVYGKIPAGKHVPAGNRAETYVNRHKKLFARYWKWREQLISQYKRDGYLMLADGWCLFEGEDRPNTVANFPIQGLGAVILRRAMYYATVEGLEVISPLHDCIYVLSEPADVEDTGSRLVACMKRAVFDYCNQDLIRIDYEVYGTNWESLTSTWTKDKGGPALKALGKYMIPKGQ